MDLNILLYQVALPIAAMSLLWLVFSIRGWFEANQEYNDINSKLSRLHYIATQLLAMNFISESVPEDRPVGRKPSLVAAIWIPLIVFIVSSAIAFVLVGWMLTPVNIDTGRQEQFVPHEAVNIPGIKLTESKLTSSDNTLRDNLLANHIADKYLLYVYTMPGFSPEISGKLAMTATDLTCFFGLYNVSDGKISFLSDYGIEPFQLDISNFLSPGDLAVIWVDTPLSLGRDQFRFGKFTLPSIFEQRDVNGNVYHLGIMNYEGRVLETK